ncbi:protein ANTI-SILENCING 1-like isoform X1 [Pyrus communis]|uniref:protein ANTI-SILENCING 1-like isoform X1 n=1 Tax=Pyrus communis TaxID=23211 RepID=UPI0035C0D581
MEQDTRTEKLEFTWGKKKGKGGKNKDVQFYESFTFDGEEYTLYDCVYLYKEDEPEPEIGKLIKIWETGEKAKKVKVLWFFRPCEISNFLGGEEVLENELFLASGDGVGLANLNPLEAIAGKCNVLCISKDKENPQPSDEELQMAEFVFRRTFDVGLQKITDKIEGAIAGIDVKFMFNRKDIQKPGGVLKVDLGKNEVCGNSIASNETVVLSNKNSFKENITLETNGNIVDSSTLENGDLVKHKPSLVEKPAYGVGLNSNEKDKMNEKQEHVSNPKVLLSSEVKSDEGEVKRGKVHAQEVEVEEKVTFTKDNVDSDNRPTKKAKLDDDKGSEQILAEVERKKKCTNVCDPKAKNDTSIEAVNDKKNSSDLNCMNVTKAVSPKVPVEVDHGQSKKPKLDTSIEVPNDKSKSSDLRRVNATKVLSSTTSALDDESKHKCVEDSLGTNNAFLKKMKPDDKAMTISKGNNGKLPKASQRKVKHVEDSRGANEESCKKIKLDEKSMALSDGKLPKVPPTQSQSMVENVDGQEVTRRPDVDRRTWFKGFPWEDRIQAAHEQGTLVLLQNLDPACTSALVEDILWHGFKESCTAKMIQRTANSSPHYGQALVILKTREAAQKVVRELDKGCLLLSNGRPLVGSFGTPCSSEKKAPFFGHLTIEKLRHQNAREMKEAISTSHCSQPNTIEYDMAMEWCLQQERSDLLWRNLYKQQGKELRKLKAELKLKPALKKK